MCKHVAAVMYGVGARLDERPELLFILRGVDHAELVTEDAAKAVVSKGAKTDRRTLDESELSEVFGIDVTPAPAAKATARTTDARLARSAARRSVQPAQRLERRTVPAPVLQRAGAKRAGRKRSRGE
jgi:uncharacterized Zn finger protein